MIGDLVIVHDRKLGFYRGAKQKSPDLGGLAITSLVFNLTYLFFFAAFLAAFFFGAAFLAAFFFVAMILNLTVSKKNCYRQ
jgi:hypothetical protein